MIFPRYRTSDIVLKMSFEHSHGTEHTLYGFTVKGHPTSKFHGYSFQHFAFQNVKQQKDLSLALKVVIKRIEISVNIFHYLPRTTDGF